MRVSEVIERMILMSGDNMHDISHFLKVHAFARMIGERESLDSQTQQILELAAIVHDIACPLCREKYGNTDGHHQEAESDPLVREFFAPLLFSETVVERVSWLVCHHHTYTGVEGIDHRILLEADFLVNSDESAMALQAIRSASSLIFRTETGRKLLHSIYLKGR